MNLHYILANTITIGIYLTSWLKQATTKNDYFLNIEAITNQAFTMLAALLNNDFPVLNNFSVKLSQFFRLEVMNM